MLNQAQQTRKELLATMTVKELEMELALVESALDKLNYGAPIDPYTIDRNTLQSDEYAIHAAGKLELED